MATIVAPLTPSHVLAISIFASYFLFIFFLLYIILSSIRNHAHYETHPKRALVFSGLTVVSFAHTWYWAVHYMAWSFRNFENTRFQGDVSTGPLILRIAIWLTDTPLFEQAWFIVCAGPLHWWWSEQLCLFTAGALTIFLYLQRERVPHVWAYMLLGQVVAISVAWSLVNLALVLIPPPRAASNAKNVLPLSLTIPVLFSLLTVSFSPYTSSTTFLPNLVAMHALLVFPLLPIPFIAPPRLSPRSTSFYTLIALLSMILRIRTTLTVLSVLHITSNPFFSVHYPVDATLILWNAPGKLYGQAWETLHSHPALASIGWDVIWTSVIWLVWGLCGERDAGKTQWTLINALPKMFPTAVASIGVVAPMEFGRTLREDMMEPQDDKTE